MNWKGNEAKQYYLLVITGFVVACVWHGVHRHWDSWGVLAYWFASTVVLMFVGAAAMAAIIYSHKFFLGYDNKNLTGGAIYFYIMMTLLTAALFVGLAEIARPSGD
jgi:hypothetical protein